MKNRLIEKFVKGQCFLLFFVVVISQLDCNFLLPALVCITICGISYTSDAEDELRILDNQAVS